MLILRLRPERDSFRATSDSEPVPADRRNTSCEQALTSLPTL
jgi:hypothetical protein